MKKILFLLFVVWSLALTASPLFEKRSSNWQIVIPEKPSTTEFYAAKELQYFLKRISGVDLAIKQSGNAAIENAIVIGTPESFPQLPEAVKDFPEGISGNDSLRVKTLSGSLYLTGNVPRGALYAVYTFLKDVMGVRWVFAGKNGEYVPEKTHFTLPVLDIYEVAKFKYRGFHLCGQHYDKEMETWMARNKINIMRSDPVSKAKWVKNWNSQRIAKGFHMMFSTHNVAIRDKQVFAQHPEYFAEINGKRMIDQLCWSHPEVEKIMLERLLKYCREYPAVEIINLSAADNMNYCRCEKCGTRPVHEVWFEFYNKLASGVRQKFPDVKFATIAYQAYKKVPQCDMSSSTFVEYCMYDRCYVHRYGECKMNDKALRNVTDWQKKSVPVVIYGYEFDVFKPKAQSPFYYMISDQMKKFHASGIAGAITECNPFNWVSSKLPKGSVPGANHNKLAMYLYAAALWNHNVDPDAVIREFSEAAYGNAAPFMSEYAMKMGKSWDKMKNHYSYFYNSPFGCAESLLNGKLISDIEAIFRKADAAVKTEKSPARRQVITANFDEERRVFNVWKGFYQNSISSKSSMKILIPRTKKPLDFSGCTPFDRFIAKDGRKPVKPWSFRMNYDDKAIYLDVKCLDDDMKNLVSSRNIHDEKVYTDECVELFFAVPNDTRGIYRHLVANASGTRYDSVALGGFTFDLAWNPQWQVKAFKGKNFWQLQMTVPFAALESAPPKAGDVWAFSIKRSNGGRKFPNTGFPDAAYHDQNAFGFIQFSGQFENIPAYLSAPRQNAEKAGELQSQLEKAGFELKVSKKSDEISQIKGNGKLYIFRHTPATKYKAEFFSKTVLPALQNGALVIFSGWGNLPVDKYFNEPKLKLKWSGWNAERGRKSFNVKGGSLLTYPENIEKLLKRGITPVSGFLPENSGVWEEFAQIKLKDGNYAAFLLTAKVGKGMIAVTTGDFGFGGGLAIFGKNISQSVNLVKNLYHHLNNSK